MPNDILDRIQKLIQLATKNPNEEEARSAAMMALRLIQTHHVVLSLPQQGATRQAPIAARSSVFTEDMLADLRRAMQNQRQQPRRSPIWDNDYTKWYQPYEPPKYEPPEYEQYEPPKYEPPK